MPTETIVTGKKFRKLVDVTNKVWQRISFWTKASDVEFDDGKTAESKVGVIDGITSDINGQSDTIAASIKVVNQMSGDLSSSIKYYKIDADNTYQIVEIVEGSPIDLDSVRHTGRYAILVPNQDNFLRNVVHCDIIFKEEKGEVLKNLFRRIEYAPIKFIERITEPNGNSRNELMIYVGLFVELYSNYYYYSDAKINLYFMLSETGMNYWENEISTNTGCSTHSERRGCGLIYGLDATSYSLFKAEGFYIVKVFDKNNDIKTIRSYTYVSINYDYATGGYSGKVTTMASSALDSTYGSVAVSDTDRALKVTVKKGYNMQVYFMPFIYSGY